MAGTFRYTKRKCANICLFTSLHYATKQNIIPNSQVVKEILDLENLTNLIGQYLFNPLLNKQNVLSHAITINDGHNYLEKQHF